MWLTSNETKWKAVSYLHHANWLVQLTHLPLVSPICARTIFSEILMKKLFIHENISENIVCKMAAILSRGGGGGVKKITTESFGVYKFPQSKKPFFTHLFLFY